MPRRSVIFAPTKFYHIYNRSIGDEAVFVHKNETKRALFLMDYYRFKTPMSYSAYRKLDQGRREETLRIIQSSSPFVEIYAFCLMPNHFHFLLREMKDYGVRSFISNFQNGFAKYYNIKKKRNGGVFCNMFKGVYIESEEQFIHVARYIHLNPVTSFLISVEELNVLESCSYSTYMGKFQHGFINKEKIESFFTSPQKHKEFVFNQEDYQKKLVGIKQKIIDFPEVGS